MRCSSPISCPPGFLHGLSVSQKIRQYCNVVVFWAWLAQIFEANASLSKAVSLVQAWCRDAGLPVPGQNTGAYSKGRDRLGMDFLAAASARVLAPLESIVRDGDIYQRHIIKSIDGSSLAHDAPVFRKLLHCFHSGDLVCADRAFCSYEIKTTLHEKNVYTLIRLHQARHAKLDWRKGRRIGKNQRIVTWKKPSQQPVGSTLNAEEWAALPGQLEVRLIRFYYEDREGKKRHSSLIACNSMLEN